MEASCASALFACFNAFSADALDVLPGWDYEAIPYVWTAGLEGRLAVGESTGSIDGGFEDLVDFLDVGVALRMSARRPPVDWFIEANYLGYARDANSPSSAARLESTQTFGEVGLSYELDATLAFYGGLRAQQIDAALDVLQGHAEGVRSWADAIVGVRWTPVPAERWRPWLRGDIGGGGSSRVWLAEAGLSYRWTNRWAIYVAYRMLDTQYDRDDFIYDMRQSGLLCGFGAQF